MMWHGTGYGMGFPLFWILVVLGVIIVIVQLARLRNSPERDSSSRERSAIDVLEHRLARGEIDEEEYRWRRELIQDK